MENIDIIARLDTAAATLTESDLDQWVVPTLLEHYRRRISFLASKVYGFDPSEVARGAFNEMAKGALRNALVTFFFRKEHWKQGRSINSYLLVTLGRLGLQAHNDLVSAKRQNFLICPVCKEFGDKVPLVSEDRQWRCRTCTSEIDRLEDELKKNNSATVTARLQCHRSFQLHSRRGYRCPDCTRFIPESHVQKNGVECPYLKCSYFGKIEDLEEMAHPSMMATRQNISLDAPIHSDGMESTKLIGDTIESNGISAETQIVITQTFDREYRLLGTVIEQQIEMVRRMNAKGTYMQKLLMYEAFKRMLAIYPEEMVSYLVHLRQSREFPIQARIFQEYLSCIEEILPFTIEKHGEEIDIMSLNDPNLDIFDGKSIYEAVVNDDGIVPNNTIETYTGLRKFKEHGSCFIGKLLDIVDNKTGASYLRNVDSYSFVDIRTKGVLPGTAVTVTHYRIPAHYEMKSMVYLQRIRKHIVDKVYVRLNGSKRPIIGSQKMQHQLTA